MVEREISCQGQDVYWKLRLPTVLASVQESKLGYLTALHPTPSQIITISSSYNSPRSRKCHFEEDLFTQLGLCFRVLDMLLWQQL